mmetsp:Transcript_52221/g.137901  ORF Transcript_52221/g.137901 Transcript_52221/m.137901 type:complete len:442 (+) Transcript_52221:1610-2935(+)
MVHHDGQHPGLGALLPHRRDQERVRPGLRRLQPDLPGHPGEVLLHHLGPRRRLDHPRDLLPEPHPAGDRAQQGGRGVRHAQRHGPGGADRSGYHRPHVDHWLDGLRLLPPVAGVGRLHSQGLLRHLRGGLRHRRGGLHQRHAGRLHGQVAHGLCLEGLGLSGRQVLALRPAPLRPRRPVRHLLLLLPVEQRLPHRGGAMHHRRRGRRVVLHAQRGEGEEEHDDDRRQEHVQVPPGLDRLRLADHRHHPVHPLRDEVLREAGGGAEEHGHEIHPQVLAVLHVVLREVHEVPQQERLHPDRPAGHPLLHVREEGVLPHPSQRPPLRDRGDPLRRHQQHRVHLHHGGHSGPGVHLPQRHAPGDLPALPALRLHLRRLRGRQAVHERLRPGGGHQPPVRDCRGGAEPQRRLRAESAQELPAPRGEEGRRPAVGGAEDVSAERARA